MKNTAIQEAIGRINNRLLSINEGDYLNDFQRGMLITLKDNKKMLEMLLEKEKKDLIDSYNQGQFQTCGYPYGEEHYNQTFKQ